MFLPASFLAETAVDPPAWLILPFVLLLASIALAPTVAKHHWERFYHLFSVGLGLVPVLYYVFILRSPGRVATIARDYVSFLSLIGSLFTVAGGIHIIVKGEAKPWMNCVFLLVGALVANLIGTTGASMLLIRPWIRMNRYRFTALHTIFFIFIVSNIGGCLTPIGDPPLFLGFLKGVPFWWVLVHCWPAWLVGVLGTTALFYYYDRVNYLKAPKKEREAATAGPNTWRFGGLKNLLFLAVILGAVFIRQPVGLREVIMLAAAVASYRGTHREIHNANDFTFGPIREVAWLFAGIFGTMMPALDYLQRHAASLGLDSAMQYYWCTGALSGVLDNAPTYLTFLASAFGRAGLDLENSQQVATFLTQQVRYLQAISVGAVFFGAMTYIGNGPNLMVKSIVDAAGIRTPSFFRYIFGYSFPVLLPCFGLIAWLFFAKGAYFQ